MTRFSVFFAGCVCLTSLWSGNSAAELAKVELTRESYSSSTIEEVGSKLANSLLQQNLSGRLFTVPDRVGGAPVEVSGGPDSSLVLSYRDSNNELSVLNSVVTSDLSGNDVGEAAAEEVFEMALQSVQRDLDLKNLGGASLIRRSKVSQGEGSGVKEYVFSLPRVVQDVEIMNSGVEISVHRDGRLARIMVFGADLGQIVGEVSRNVSDDEIDARALRENPDSSVERMGLRYWLPDGLTHGVEVPQVEYSLTSGRTVLYSVEDPNRPAVEVPAARTGAEEEPR